MLIDSLPKPHWEGSTLRTWKDLRRETLVKVLDAYGTPFRHAMKKAELIRVIERLIEMEKNRDGGACYQRW